MQAQAGEIHSLGGRFFKPCECDDCLFAVVTTHMAIKLELLAHGRASRVAKQLA